MTCQLTRLGWGPRLHLVTSQCQSTRAGHRAVWVPPHTTHLHRWRHQDRRLHIRAGHKLRSSNSVLTWHGEHTSSGHSPRWQTAATTMATCWCRLLLLWALRTRGALPVHWHSSNKCQRNAQHTQHEEHHGRRPGPTRQTYIAGVGGASSSTGQARTHGVCTPFCANRECERLPFQACRRRASMRWSNTKQVKAGRDQTRICQRKANCAQQRFRRRRVHASRRNPPMRCSELRGTRDM